MLKTHLTTINASQQLFLDAVSQNNLPLTKQLLSDRTLTLEKQTFTPPPTFIAAHRNSASMLKLLLEAGFPANLHDISAQNGTILHYFAGQNSLELAKIAANYTDLNEVNDQGQTALMVSIIKKNDAFTMFLVNSGANLEILDKFCKSATFYAKSAGNDELLKILPDIKWNWEDAHKKQQEECRKGSNSLLWNAAAGTKMQKNVMLKKGKKGKKSVKGKK